MIRGTEGLSDAEILEDVRKGGRFVLYLYCISVVVLTFKRSSGVIYIRSGGSRLTPGLGWTALTCLLGWWGIPWGPVYSIQSIYTNLRGGTDVTDQIVRLPEAQGGGAG